MRGHPELSGVFAVADAIVSGVGLDPAVRRRLYTRIAQALVDEREACAKAADWWSPSTLVEEQDWHAATASIAAAIRAR